MNSSEVCHYSSCAEKQNIGEHGLIALDWGSVWGGKPTAIRIEDDAVFQVPG